MTIKEFLVEPPPTAPRKIVKQILRKYDITQIALVRATGIEESHLSMILNGRRRMSPEKAALISVALGLDPRVLAVALAEYEAWNCVNANPAVYEKILPLCKIEERDLLNWNFIDYGEDNEK